MYLGRKPLFHICLKTKVGKQENQSIASPRNICCCYFIWFLVYSIMADRVSVSILLKMEGGKQKSTYLQKESETLSHQ
jgi:hypothetical protein